VIAMDAQHTTLLRGRATQRLVLLLGNNARRRASAIPETLFVLGSYLYGAPTVVEDNDVQPRSLQQLGEFIKRSVARSASPRPQRQNSWKTLFPQVGCVPPPMRPGGPGQLRWQRGVASNYFLPRT